MSMLMLRQVPLRGPALRRFDWPSPTMVPRSWMTALFAASAAYAVAMALVTSNPLHRTWGIFAACSYLFAAMLVLAWPSRGRDAALLLSLAGALVVPLGLMAAARLQQPEVRVINKSATLLVQHGTPYLGPASLAAAHSPNIFDPYLPLMTLFGMPRALLGFSVLTDPRIWFGVGFVIVFAAALAVVGVRDVMRWTVLVTASPVIAFSLSVGGTDVPVLACLCLGLALLWREPHPLLAGLALGVAAGMKATAWPAVLIAVVMVAVRDGRRAAGILTGTSLAVFASIVGPAAGRDRARRTLHRGGTARAGLPRHRGVAGRPAAAHGPGRDMAPDHRAQPHVRAGPGHPVRVLPLPGGAAGLAGHLLARLRRRGRRRRPAGCRRGQAGERRRPAGVPVGEPGLRRGERDDVLHGLRIVCAPPCLRQVPQRLGVAGPVGELDQTRVPRRVPQSAQVVFLDGGLVLARPGLRDRHPANQFGDPRAERRANIVHHE